MALLHLLVQLGQDLLGLDVLVEVEHVATQIDHHLDLANQDLVQLLNIVLDVRARLVDVLEDGHFFFDDFDALLAAGVVLEDKLLFLFKDLLNDFLVVLGKLLDVVGILHVKLIESWNAVTQFFLLGCCCLL